MTKELLEYVTAKTHDMMAAPSCSKEAKAAGQAWLDAAGTDREAAETKKYIAELEADIAPIDGLIAFAGSEHAEKYLGADAAKGLLMHAEQIKAAGAKFCDCPACAAAAAILEKKEQLL